MDTRCRVDLGKGPVRVLPTRRRIREMVQCLPDPGHFGAGVSFGARLCCALTTGSAVTITVIITNGRGDDLIGSDQV